ncbi:MAG: hypothetical protein R3B82_24350 [Sandaracinaceae bacterium]
MSGSFDTRNGAAVARRLVLDLELVVGGEALRVEEAEAYFHGPGHEDPFAHRHPVQSTPGRWYFHRAGAGTYRGGSFKGLDLTFGPEGTFGGVLVRTVSRRGALVSGPSRVVDLLLALAGVDRVAALDDGRDALDPRGALHLRRAPRDEAVLRTARVGLTLKRHVAGDERPRWLLVRDRFLAETRIPKGRVHAVVALHQAGLDPAAVRQATGSTAVERYLARYAQGLAGGGFEAFAGRALSDADYAELHGIWTRRHGSDTIVW